MLQLVHASVKNACHAGYLCVDSRDLEMTYSMYESNMVGIMTSQCRLYYSIIYDNHNYVYYKVRKGVHSFCSVTVHLSTLPTQLK